MTPYIAVFAPLAAFLIAGLFNKQITDRGAQLVTCVAVIASASASVMLFFDVISHGHARTVPLMTWIAAGDFKVDWALRIDQLSVVMMCVINIVSACVHVYSVGYMSHDKAKGRFMAYLSLFTFAMLMLVTADNLLQIFFGWEGVGLASYLLIGFWNHKESANAASMKAFIVNRVGDFGLALGVMGCFLLFGTVEFEPMFEAASKADPAFLTITCLLLFMGAMGKSAQLGLHTWLPDAMEGPTPVSALIHAATMVTAGVFLIARLSPLFEYAPFALQTVCIVGALTAFVAATIGLTQFDIKRVIAYSTMSQLGYMFFALGVSAYSAAMFHLVTHAFFKALLFLGAGSVIHAMSDEQDMRKMGGIWKKIPVTYTLMWIGSLALAGVPFFAGYYSKDLILEAAFADHTWFGNFAYWMGIAAAVMTAFYSWRLIIMTFHGKPRADEKVMAHVHESPPVMVAPLLVLAVGAVLAGYAFKGGFADLPGAHHVVHGDKHHKEEIHHEDAHDKKDVALIPKDREAFWGDALYVKHENDTVEAAHHVPYWVKKLPIGAGIAGILLAYLAYMWQAGLAEKFASAMGVVNRFLFRKWYFDELYDLLFVRPALKIGNLFSTGDREVVDKFGPDGTACLSKSLAGVLSRFQSGYVFQYAFIMMAGLVGLVLWAVYRLGG